MFESSESYEFMGFYIPKRMEGSIIRYIEDGINPGRFLTAVICNDLLEAVSRADNENLANLPAYVDFFYNQAPRLCWGSKEKMERWIASRTEIRKED